MSENLTLSIDSEIIEFANDFSRKINKPLSRIIEDYFIELKERNENDLPEDLQELYGVFEGTTVPDKYELRKMFHEKQGCEKMNIITADANTVNFREIRCGNIAPETLFRSSHPIPGGGQEPVIAMLAAQNRIAAVINLSDTVSELKRKVFFAPWYNRLFINNKVIALGMDFSVTGDSYNQKLKKALRFIIKTESPWLIHCHAGIDRTGFVSMVIEALMGASIDAIAGDYLKSFNSIFESSIYDHSTQFDLPVVMRLLSVMSGSLTISDQNLQGIAEQYLKNKIGLSIEEINLLKMKLSDQFSSLP